MSELWIRKLLRQETIERQHISHTMGELFYGQDLFIGAGKLNKTNLLLVGLEKE